MTERLKVIDLFCGVGGSTLGFKMAGFKIVLAVDIDRVVLQSYHANHPEVEILEKDILKISADDLPEADVILGSTPCATFSKLKRNRTNDMTLTNHFLEIIKDYNPRYWMLENVPQLAKFLPQWVSYDILCTADYGVPQRRKRCIAGNYPMPEQTHSEKGGTLTDLDKKPWINFGAIKNGTGTKPLSKRALEGVYHRANKMGKKGYNFTIQFIDENNVLPTLTSSEYHGLRAASVVIYDNGTLRKLSWLECVRTQSFPDDYIFKGTIAQRYHQLGDAVPPLLAKAMASAIKKHEISNEKGA